MLPHNKFLKLSHKNTIKANYSCMLKITVAVKNNTRLMLHLKEKNKNKKILNCKLKSKLSKLWNSNNIKVTNRCVPNVGININKHNTLVPPAASDLGEYGFSLIRILSYMCRIYYFQNFQNFETQRISKLFSCIGDMGITISNHNTVFPLY